MSNTREKATDTTKLLLRASEVAERLSIGRGTAYELMASGVLQSVRIGRSIRVPSRTLDAFIERKERETKDESKN